MTIRRALLAGIVLVYLVLACLYALNTPAWQAPDEPAHYNYIRSVAETGSFPVLHVGDYPHAYLEQIKQAQFHGMDIAPIRYESHQPPLYYVLLAPIYTLAGGSLVALRLASVVLGLGIVLLAYACALRAFRGRAAPALATAAFVAFLPQHLATVSQVGNDVLAELLFAAVLYVLLGWVLRPADRGHALATPELLLTGVLLGLILITKTTAFIAIPLAGGVLLWRLLQAGRSGQAPAFSRMVVEALALFLPAAIIAVPWLARNVWAYGWPDIFGLIRHDQVVTGQPRTAGFILDNGWAAYWRRAGEWTFKSFWGVFGWMSAWLDSRVYFALALLSGVFVAGGFARLLQRTPARPAPERSAQPSAAPLLLVSAFLTLLTYVYYNVSFLQHQGRYLFTALIPIAIGVAAAWESAMQPRTARILAGLLVVFAIVLAAWSVLAGAGLPKWPLAITAAFAGVLAVASLLPKRLRPLAYALPFACLPLVGLYALFNVVVPQLK